MVVSSGIVHLSFAGEQLRLLWSSRGFWWWFRNPPSLGGCAWGIPPNKNGPKWLENSWRSPGFFCLLETTDLHSLQWNSPHFHHFLPKWEELINTNYTYMHGAFLCIKFNCRTHVQFLPSEFGTQLHNIWRVVLTPFWSLLSSNWSKYLKCWVFSLFFCFTGTISTCERFLGEFFFNVFHPFPQFQPFLHFSRSLLLIVFALGGRSFPPSKLRLVLYLDWFSTVKTACGC